MTRAFHQKTVLITGGTSGIGRATALELARHGADVTIVGRNQEQGMKVLAEMQHYHGKGAFMRANLAVMREVRRVAQEFHNQHSTLNALVLSAGVLNFRRIITEDGLESNFATNYLGRFLITQRLLPLLKASTPARIVLIGAAGANPDPKLDFENLQGERQFAGFAAISQSHFANDLFVAQLARQLTDTGVTVNALHPGLVNTGIMRSAPLPMKLLSPFFVLRADSVEEGAKAPVYLVTAAELTGTNGSYFRKMKPIAPAPSTFDAQLGRRLWQISEHLIQQILAETAHAITA